MEELPAKTEIVREIELSSEEAALYEASRKKALKELQEIKNANSGPGRLQILAALTRLWIGRTGSAQTRPVTVYRLITQGTIEEKIVRLHHEKRDIADKLFEGTEQAAKLSVED